jgi:hypothetical protein
VLKQALAMLGQSRRIPRLALWPPCGQQCPDTHTDRDRCSATTSNDVSAPTSIDVLAGFPKPRVAGSIPAGGTPKIAGQRPPWAPKTDHRVAVARIGPAADTESSSREEPVGHAPEKRTKKSGSSKPRRRLAKSTGALRRREWLSTVTNQPATGEDETDPAHARGDGPPDVP